MSAEHIKGSVIERQKALYDQLKANPQRDVTFSNDERTGERAHTVEIMARFTTYGKPEHDAKFIYNIAKVLNEAFSTNDSIYVECAGKPVFYNRFVDDRHHPEVDAVHPEAEPPWERQGEIGQAPFAGQDTALSTHLDAPVRATGAGAGAAIEADADSLAAIRVVVAQEVRIALSAALSEIIESARQS